MKPVTYRILLLIALGGSLSGKVVWGDNPPVRLYEVFYYVGDRGERYVNIARLKSSLKKIVISADMPLQELADHIYTTHRISYKERENRRIFFCSSPRYAPYPKDINKNISILFGQYTHSNRYPVQEWLQKKNGKLVVIIFPVKER